MSSSSPSGTSGVNSYCMITRGMYSVGLNMFVDLWMEEAEFSQKGSSRRWSSLEGGGGPELCLGPWAGVWVVSRDWSLPSCWGVDSGFWGEETFSSLTCCDGTRVCKGKADPSTSQLHSTQELPHWAYIYVKCYYFLHHGFFASILIF